MKPTWYWDDLRWYYDDISWDYIDVIGIDWVIFANRNNINTFGLVWVDPCASRLLPGYDESIRCMDEFILRNSPAWKVMLGLLGWCDFCQDFIANWWIVIWIDTWHHLTIIWHHLTPSDTYTTKFQHDQHATNDTLVKFTMAIPAASSPAELLSRDFHRAWSILLANTGTAGDHNKKGIRSL